MSSFAFQRKFSLKNFTIHFYLEHNSLNYKVFPIFSIIGSAYFLIFFFSSFPWIVGQCKCKCMLVYACTCLHMFVGREDRFLTYTSRILAWRLRVIENVCLFAFEAVFIWTYNTSWPNYMWAPPGVFPGSLFWCSGFPISPECARCFLNGTLIQQIWNQWGLVVKREGVVS